MNLDSRAVQMTALVLLSVFWALNWPVMKVGLTAVEPWTFRAVMVGLGGAGCLALARILGQRIAVSRAELWPLLAVGLLQGLLWNALSGFALVLVEAGRAAVLAFTMPVWATLFAAIFLKEGISLRRFIGLVVGMAAMALLVLPALGSLGGTLLGTLIMLAAAMCWGASTVIVRGVRWTMSPLVLGGWQSAIGTGPLILAALVLGDPASLLNLDLVTGGALAFATIFPMIFCQAVFFAIVRRVPASIASMSTLMVPPLGVFFSAALIDERVGPYEIGALVLVMVAMVFTLPGLSWRPRRRRPPPSLAS